MSEVIVYTLGDCPNCDALKEFLREIDAEYVERDMSSVESQTELYFNGVFVRVAPILRKEDKFLTITELFSKGNLDKNPISKFVVDNR